MLFILDIAILFTILECFIVILKGYSEINYLCIILIVYSIVVLLFLIYNILTLPFVIAIFFLSLSFVLTSIYIVFHNYDYILLYLLLLSGVYTVYLLRCNIGITSAKLNIYGIIHSIMKNPFIIIILFLMLFISFVIRYLVLKDLTFSISYEYFLFYYLILFCLWLPTKVFMDLILTFILKRDFKFNTEDITMDKLTTMLICCIVSLTFKSIVALLIYNGAINTNNIFNIFNNLKTHKIPNFITSIISNKHIVPKRLRLSMLPVILGVELPYSNAKNEELRLDPNVFQSIRGLKTKGYTFYEKYNLILPYTFELDTNKNIAKQLVNMKDQIFVKVSKGGALPLWKVRGKITESLNIQMKELYRFNGFNPTPRLTVMNDINFRYEMYISDKNPKIESFTYGFMDCLLHEYFTRQNGFIIVPQSNQTNGQVDFIVKRYGRVWAVVESKSLAGKYSLTDLYTQVTDYADKNHHFEYCYVIANKGTFISFGIFSQDFHSMNGYTRKLTFFDGYIGLEADTNFNVKPVPQKNTVGPQHRMYSLTHKNMHQNRSVCSILQYMADNGIDLSTLDWGSKFKTDFEGSISKRKT